MTTETNKGSAFSLFNAPITNKYPTAEVHLKDIFDYLISGKATEGTAYLRSITDKAVARAYKATHFNYATFSGIFRSRADRELIRHSELICIDFDHLPCPETTRNRLLEDPYFETQLVFTSPSGDDLKWIIPIDITTASHTDYFRAISNYVRQTYGIEADKSGKDISRACFLPHDSNTYLNPKYL